MKHRLTLTGNLFGLMVCAVAALAANTAQAEQVVKTYKPLTSVPEGSLTQKGEIVMTALYKELGMEFPIQGRDTPTPPPAPAPAPTPAPTPTPQPAPSPQPTPEPKKDDPDDFFGNDDFFDDDVGFDDIAEGFDKEFEETVSDWDKEYEETLKRWGLAKKEFNKNKQQYKDATYDFDRLDNNQAIDGTPLAGRDSRPNPSKSGDFHVIPYAFTQAPQDQKSRGTCAAFAAIRAIESLIAQHEVNTIADDIDLSEQQFFFLSRVDCMEAPCRPVFDQRGTVTNDGSLYDVGFNVVKTIDHPDASLMPEELCQYRPVIENNVSYSPLEDFCSTNRGPIRHRVTEFSPKIPFEAIRRELDANRPIAASFRLPNSFFNSNGLVSLIDPKTNQGTGPHTGGHAITLIGYVILPEKFWAMEGKYCAITANSWGEGWGKGGYACLTEKWMRKFYKYSTSISQVNQVRL